MTTRVRPAPAPRATWRSTFNQTGTNFPVMQDILKYVVDKGKSLLPKDKVGETLYNRGVLNSIIIAEAIRNAQKITGKKVDQRRGHAARPRDARHHARRG